MSDQITKTKSDVPGDIELLRPWFNVIRDARSAGQSSGLSIVTLCVVTDDCGMPVQWCKAESVKLSPLSQREQFELMLKTMAGDKSIPRSGKKEEDTNGKRAYRKTQGQQT